MSRQALIQMVNGVLLTADLQAITQYTRISDVRRCLDEQGIRYFWGRGGIWTTIDLVNAAGGLRPDLHREYPADAFQ